jgi:hypothetical protein
MKGVKIIANGDDVKIMLGDVDISNVVSSVDISLRPGGQVYAHLLVMVELIETSGLESTFEKVWLSD